MRFADFRGVFLSAWVFWAAAAATARVESPQLAVWCEFMPYAEVHRHLPVLARNGADLILHVGPQDVGDPELARVCRAAQGQGVRVMAWFLLPYDQHLYVGEDSLEATEDLAKRFAEWSHKERLGVEWLVFDCEPSPLLGRELFASVRRGRVWELARRLRSERDPQRFQASVAKLRRLLEELRAQGFRVMGSANRILLDMYRHGNTDLQDALNTPFTMIPWDRASFITYRYRTGHGQYVAMMRRYARLARGCFGDDAALDIGLIGDQRSFPEHRERAVLFRAEKDFLKYLKGMTSVEELRSAVGAATNEGLKYVNLYSLEGAVHSEQGLEAWLQAARAPSPPSGWRAWRPLATARLGALGFLLNGLYQGLVGTAAPVAEGWASAL